MQQRPGQWLLIGFPLGLLFLAGCTNGRGTKQTPSVEPPIMAEPEKGRITFTGTLFPNRYNTRRDRYQGHHAIVWEEGGTAPRALIEAAVSDVEIQRALESLGLQPGNNLTLDTWEARGNPDNPEPDKRVTGPRLDITLEWETKTGERDGDQVKRLSLHEAFEKVNPGEIDIRFGGHEEFIPIWQSGCVTCTFSCPGGRTSNASYTIRDQVRKRRSFQANEEILPPDGTEVRIIVEVRSSD